MVTAEVHLEIGRRFIQQADEEFANGDLLQASEKAWGAVAHVLKAIAMRRGWPHGSHRHFNRIVDGLTDDTEEDDRLSSLYSRANGLHINFYEAVLSESQVRYHMEDVKELLALLVSMD